MKSFISGLLLFISCGIAQAQITVRPHIGFNLSQAVNEPENFDASAHLGSQFGAFFTVGNKLFLQSGLQYAAIGSDFVYKKDGQYFNEEVTAVFRGLRVPLYVGWRPNQPEKVVNFRLFVGPSLAWVFSKESGNTSLLPEDTFSDTLWGANIGAGFDLWLFFLDLSFEFGMSEAYQELSTKNHVMALNGGVRLKLGEGK